MSGHNTGTQGTWIDATVWCGPLYDGVVYGLNSGHLARVELELLGFKRWFLNLVRRNVGFQWMEGF